MVTQSLKNEKKKTVIGTIPEDWDIINIEKSSFLKGRIGWQGLTTKEYLSMGEFFLVTGTEFSNGSIDWYKCNYVSKRRFVQDPNIKLRKNDILVTKDGTIGKVAFVNSLPLPATLNSGVFVIRPLNESYAPKYLFYVLQSNYFKRFIEVLKAGSTISHLYQYSFKNFTFPLPKLPEQQSISKILSEVDTLIESLDVLISKKKNIKQGLMQTLLTRGIGHTKFKRTEIGEMPEEWTLKRLEKVCEICDDKRIPLSEKVRENKKGIFPYCGANGIVDYIDDYILDGEYVLLAEDGGHYGKSEPSAYFMKGKFWVNNHAHVLKGIRDEMDNVFLLSSLNYLDIGKYILGTTRLKLNQQVMRSIVLPYPEFKEQQKIARILSDTYKEIETLEQKRDKYKLLKTGMMQQLLTGGIRVK